MKRYTKDFGSYSVNEGMGRHMDHSYTVIFDDRNRFEAAFETPEDAFDWFLSHWNGNEGWVITIMHAETLRQYINLDGMERLSVDGMVTMADGDFMERRGKLSVPFGR